jgi:hypothetical protein
MRQLVLKQVGFFIVLALLVQGCSTLRIRTDTIEQKIAVADMSLNIAAMTAVKLHGARIIDDQEAMDVLVMLQAGSLAIDAAWQAARVEDEVKASQYLQQGL